jgi:predicted O-methyltransferase YrrM
MLDAQLRAFLSELESVGLANDAHTAERRYKLLNLERPTAELVWMLLQSTRRRQVLEIGTSNGYSTIWLAAALRDIEGPPLISIELFPEKVAQARVNLQRAALLERVELKEGDATEVVRTLSGPFDCVFFDADRWSAPGQLHLLLPKLAPDVLLLADNILSHPAEIAEYREMVEHLPGFAWTVVPIGKGLHIAWRRQHSQA